MRALANFIMQGRVQATVVAIVGSLLPLISPAAVALVGLRRGVLDGSILALWALLPLIVGGATGYVEPLMAALYSAAVVVVAVSALALRQTFSWNTTLIILMIISVVVAQVIGLLAHDLVEQLLADIRVVLEKLEAKADIEFQYVVALLGYFVAVNGLLALLLARWWQALLYNPGGFRTELLAMRLSQPLAAGLLLGLSIAMFEGGDWSAWAGILSLPLVLLSAVLAHAVAERYSMGSQWLVLFYFALIFIGPFSLAMLAIAGLDSWFDFRGRLAAKTAKRHNDQSDDQGH